MRVLLVCDRPGWAFDSIARALVQRADGEGLEIEVFYLKGNEAELERAVARNESTFFMHWSLAGTPAPPLLGRGREGRVGRVRRRWRFLDPSRTITGIHAHHDWDERRTDPGSFVEPPKPLVRFLASFRSVNAVSRRLTELFQAAGLDNILYTANGVETDVFRPTQPLGSGARLKVGYAGTKKRDWKEGITEFIEPLAEVPWLDVRIATPEDGRHVPTAEMPAFHNDLDVYVSATRSEGLSLAVLEAGACGRPIVTTRVGGSEDLVREGHNGLFVERDQRSLLEALGRLHEDRRLLREMGENSRAEIERAWSWDHRAPAWLRFIAGEPTHR